MKLKYLHLLPLIFASSVVLAYTQSDLLNAQTNYQTAKSNNDTYKKQLDSAQDDLSTAELNLRKAESALTYAKRDLKQKQESVVAAKQILAKSNTNLNTSGLAVNNIWNQVNGKVLGSPSNGALSATPKAAASADSDE